MKLASARFLTDENIHPLVVKSLRERQHDVLDVKESGWIGWSDVDLLRLAHTEQRIVLTHDGDFGGLVIASSEPFLGIVYLRPGHINPAFTLASLEALFEQVEELLPPALLVVEHSGSSVRIRIRRM